MVKDNILPLEELQSLSRSIRGKVVEMSHKARTAHLGSSLSCIDLLVALYWRAVRIDPNNPKEPSRDRCILSKGHAASALYATLAFRGFFPKALLDTFCEEGGALAEHPSPNCLPGVEAATGSLGHGLPIGVGMALAGNIQKTPYRVFVLMSDGECNEGSVWEAAMLAPAHNLDNVVALIDYNKWQATGRSNEVLSLDPLKEKWESFGWHTHEIDGHNMKEIVAALETPPEKHKPTVIIAHTVKGKGISFMEDDNNWHYRVPTQDEVVAAEVELRLR